MRGCRPKSFGQRLGSALSHPERLLVVVLGLGLYALGIVLRGQASGTTLLVFGTLVVIIGAVLPMIVEVELGLERLSFRRVIPRPESIAETRRGDLEAYVQTSGPAVRRFALLLTGDAPTATQLVEESLISASSSGDADSVARLDWQVLCVLVHRFLGMAAIGLGSVAAGDAPPAGPVSPAQPDPVTGVLMSLPARARAVALLFHYRDMDKAEVARLVGCSRDEVDADLHVLARAVRSAQHTAVEEPT